MSLQGQSQPVTPFSNDPLRIETSFALSSRENTRELLSTYSTRFAFFADSAPQNGQRCEAKRRVSQGMRAGVAKARILRVAVNLLGRAGRSNATLARHMDRVSV